MRQAQARYLGDRYTQRGHEIVSRHVVKYSPAVSRTAVVFQYCGVLLWKYGKKIVVNGVNFYVLVDVFASRICECGQQGIFGLLAFLGQ